MITPTDIADIEEHLSKCHECTLRVEELRQTIAALKQNKGVFCPEPWELYNFAQSRDDPHGAISLHVENCPICSENLSAWEKAAVEEQRPQELWNRLRERLPGAAQKLIPSERPSWGQMVLEKLARFWKAPALAAGLAAAVLLVVMIYRAPIEPMIPIPKSLPQKTAFVVLFKDFKDPALLKQIESLYETLNDSTELKDRYSIVSPAETSEAIESGKALSQDRPAMIDRLRKSLNVSRVLVVSVFPLAEKFGIRVELIDTLKDKTLQTKTDENIEQNELAARVRSDVHSMLLAPNNQP